MDQNKTECLVMAKPDGPSCNMRCDYCYYLEKNSLFPEDVKRMDGALLEKYIVQRLRSSPGPATHFEWHGGEPTLMGLDFFREAVRLEKKHLPPGRTVTNGLQTNGILIDESWADFLSAEGFSVGLSLDGPPDAHDRFRKTVNGARTHERVVKALRLLKKREVFCNVLCVLHAGNVTEPERVYGYFRSAGASYIQFLPLVRRNQDGGMHPASAPPEAVGDFLCAVFDEWIACDAGRAVVQNSDEALRPLYGMPHSLCVHRETCGNVAVLEHDGSFYACDHFVDPAHRIGNLNEQDLWDLSADPRLLEFGAAKKASLPPECRECDVLAFCNGGCPKDRFAVSRDGSSALNYLCPAYHKFFRHCRPELTRLAAHMKSGEPLRAFRAGNKAQLG